jgi:hypothetical protein
MSETFKGLMVILDVDQKNGERKKFIDAIKMMKGVLDVQPISTDTFSDILIKQRTMATVKKELNKVLVKIQHGDIKLV